MYEIDFLPVGDSGQSGDAIAMRFTRPDGTPVVVVIDAGFQDDGKALVNHVRTWYGQKKVDLAIVTHPDGDHIGGMGHVLEELDVSVLCIHRLSTRGGGSLPAAKVVDDLIDLADSRDTAVHEPFAGDSAFEGALTFLGPDESWYKELVHQQVLEEAYRGARGPTSQTPQSFLNYLPDEIPFDDSGGTNPRNNSSAITLIELPERRMIFSGDAGVPALDNAWDLLLTGTDPGAPDFIQIPHAGSRHNASSSLLNRILGEPGQPESRTAYVSVASKSVRHPSPRVVNAYMRRGCRVYETRGQAIRHFSLDAPTRPGWVNLTPLQPMNEPSEED